MQTSRTYRQMRVVASHNLRGSSRLVNLTSPALNSCNLREQPQHQNPDAAEQQTSVHCKRRPVTAESTTMKVALSMRIVLVAVALESQIQNECDVSSLLP